eukprot:scaffold16247_cov64-Phaeocystis_antarctica.AAC.1
MDAQETPEALSHAMEGTGVITGAGEHIENAVDEIAEVDRVVKEATARWQRVEGSKLVLHLVESGDVTLADIGPLLCLAGQRLRAAQRDDLYPLRLSCLVDLEKARIRAVELG